MQKSRVLVVTVNSRTVSDAIRTVSDSLDALDGLDGAVTVVDDGKNPERLARLSAAIAANDRRSRIRVLDGGSCGGAACANIGICAGLPDGQTPDYVYLISAGARPAADALRRLVSHLDAHPETAIAGGGLYLPDGSVAPAAFRFPSLKSEFTGGAPTVITKSPGGPVGWVSLENMMLRRSAIDEIGLFDEGYPSCFEDVDLCRRARAAGWGVDHVRDSPVRLAEDALRIEEMRRRMPGFWTQARLRYFVLNHGPSYAAAATAALVSGGLLRRLTGVRSKGDPPRFLRSLVLHDMGVALRGIGRSLRSKMSFASSPISKRPQRRHTRRP